MVTVISAKSLSSLTYKCTQRRTGWFTPLTASATKLLIKNQSIAITEETKQLRMHVAFTNSEKQAREHSNLKD